MGALDPSRLLDDPTLSLYTVDPAERTALFVRTPAQIRFSRVPFLWQTQFAQATEVVAVPFREFVDLAAHARSSLERIVFVHSIGRCGSTLACRALSGSR